MGDGRGGGGKGGMRRGGGGEGLFFFFFFSSPELAFLLRAQPLFYVGLLEKAS